MTRKEAIYAGVEEAMTILRLQIMAFQTPSNEEVRDTLVEKISDALDTNEKSPQDFTGFKNYYDSYYDGRPESGPTVGHYKPLSQDS